MAYACYLCNQKLPGAALFGHIASCQVSHRNGCIDWDCCPALLSCNGACLTLEQRAETCCAELWKLKHSGHCMSNTCIHNQLKRCLQASWQAAHAEQATPCALPPPPPGMPESLAELPKGEEGVTFFNRQMSAYWKQVLTPEEQPYALILPGPSYGEL